MNFLFIRAQMQKTFLGREIVYSDVYPLQDYVLSQSFQLLKRALRHYSWGPEGVG